jgi:hypothetical protein
MGGLAGQARRPGLGRKRKEPEWLTASSTSAGEPPGYIELHGSHEQLDAAQQDEEFQRITIDASLVVADLRIAEAVTNEGIAEEMARYQAAISRVPQSV